MLGVRGGSIRKPPSRARRDCVMVGLLGDALACFEGDDDLDLFGEELWTGLELEGWLETAAETGMTQNSDSLRNFGSSTFLFGGIPKYVD